MRVAANTFPDSIVRQLQQLASRQGALQTQVATGQRVTLPEDDPAAMNQVLNLQTDIRSRTQYQRNITTLDESSTAAYGAMRGLKKISDRAQEIAVLADGTKSPEELRTYGLELAELIKQGVQFANARYNGEFLFGGTRSDAAPFATTAGPDGRVSAVTYQGNTAVREVEIGANTRVNGSVPGAGNSGAGPGGLITDTTSGADFFAHLVSLQEHLLAGNTGAIASTDRPALQRDEENLLSRIAGVGVLQARLETASSSEADQVASAGRSVTELAGADLASTLVRLNETQTAFQAALQSGAKLMGQSLMDYLR